MTIRHSGFRQFAVLAGAFFLTMAFSLSGTAPAFAAGKDQDRPNILWITSEDNSPHWLGCYGNSQAMTPRLDGLARDGIRFSQAYSNAPVCAVARSGLLTGVHAVTQGTQHMRSRYPIPKEYRPYVSYLREAGYYCTNNAKTDFNMRGNDRAIWDECSNNAHYRNRTDDQPFFAIFNLTVSHESSLFPQTVRKNRNNGLIPKQSRLAPAEIDLPPYLPDLPEIRKDFAIYHDVVSAMDAKVGELLDELQSSGLADDTIVFYYSDHGGPTPRGKRYLENTGVQVPLMIHVPKKWKPLCPFDSGSTASEPVSFVDFAPTLLSLTGIEKPPQMQGRAFLGKNRVEPSSDAVVFLYGDRFDDITGMRRGITDGRFKYIRRFTPWLPGAAYSYYPLTMPGWKAWLVAASEKSLSGYHQQIWETPQPVEYLFDLEQDPWEIENLADRAEHRSQLDSMQNRLLNEMVAVRDTGLVPESLFVDLAPNQPLTTRLKESGFDFQSAAQIAFGVTAWSLGALLVVRENIASENPVSRHWAIVGCLVHEELASSFQAELQALLTDPHAGNRIAAAHALYIAGKHESATATLLNELSRSGNEAASLLLVNTFRHLQLTGSIPADLAKSLLDDPKTAACIREMLAPTAPVDQ